MSQSLHDATITFSRHHRLWFMYLIPCYLCQFGVAFFVLAILTMFLTFKFNLTFKNFLYFFRLLYINLCHVCASAHKLYSVSVYICMHSSICYVFLFFTEASLPWALGFQFCGILFFGFISKKDMPFTEIVLCILFISSFHLQHGS